MVTEAVAELKGETPREPAEIKLEMPFDAHLPKDYVEREELRLEAYRRLAAVETAAEVADIRSEWVDRYGPLPQPAEKLLEVAHLRAECVRTGVREVTVTKATGGAGFGPSRYVVRLSPLALKASKQIRLERMYKAAVYKPDVEQLQLPISQASEAATEIVEMLQQLAPPGEEP
jgi:transcription-repair coupling factor (superfamily II helicase)